jgi:ElaB/YqjD/DUF883 family membrane-anchored ribosome-binding protein
MTYAEQLERETEEARTSLSKTLDELRSRMTPGQLLDQLTDRLNDGAPAEFARNLKNQTVKNPLPVAIMGVSLAWLVLGSRSGSGQAIVNRASDRVSDAAGAVAESVRSTAERAGELGSEWANKMSSASSDGASRGSAAGRANGAAETHRDGDGSWVESARHMAEDARGKLGSLSSSAERATSETYDGVADGGRRAAASVADSTKAAGRRAVEAGNSLAQFSREQPLLTTAIGIAIGALLGALAPSTEMENRLTGNASDQLKDEVKEVASQQYEAIKEAGEHGGEAAGTGR